MNLTTRDPEYEACLSLGVHRSYAIMIFKVKGTKKQKAIEKDCGGGIPSSSVPCLLLVNPLSGFRRIHRHSAKLSVKTVIVLDYQLKHMEMRRCGRVEAQRRGGDLAAVLAGVGQHGPLVGGGVAHDVAERADPVGDVVAAAEEEAVAGVEQFDGHAVVGQEGEGGVEGSAAAVPREAGVAEGQLQPPLARGAGAAAVEEAGKGLGQPLAVVGVVDEPQPVLRDALAAAERLGGHAGEDLHQDVVD